MRKLLFGLIFCLGFAGIGYAIYKNQTSCPVGRTEYYVFAENEVKKIMEHFKLNASFYSFKNTKILEALQQGKVQFAYGEQFFSEGKYDGLIQSEPFKVISYGIYQKKQEKSDKDIKKIGYYDEMTVPALKASYKKAELIKYESPEQLKKDVGTVVEAACVPDLFTPYMEKGSSFKILPNTKKSLVFVFSKQSKIDLQAFNKKIKEVFFEKEHKEKDKEVQGKKK